MGLGEEAVGTREITVLQLAQPDGIFSVAPKA